MAPVHGVWEAATLVQGQVSTVLRPLRPRDTGKPGDVYTLPACCLVVLAGSPDSCRRREPDLYPLCEKSPRGGPIRLNGAGKREY